MPHVEVLKEPVTKTLAGVTVRKVPFKLLKRKLLPSFQLSPTMDSVLFLPPPNNSAAIRLAPKMEMIVSACLAELALASVHSVVVNIPRNCSMNKLI